MVKYMLLSQAVLCCRYRAACAHPQRVRGGPGHPGGEEDAGRGGQRGLPQRGRQRDEGHPGRLRCPTGVPRLCPHRRLHHHRLLPHYGHGELQSVLLARSGVTLFRLAFASLIWLPSSLIMPSQTSPPPWTPPSPRVKLLFLLSVLLAWHRSTAATLHLHKLKPCAAAYAGHRLVCKSAQNSCGAQKIASPKNSRLDLLQALRLAAVCQLLLLLDDLWTGGELYPFRRILMASVPCRVTTWSRLSHGTTTSGATARGQPSALLLFCNFCTIWQHCRELSQHEHLFVPLAV